jgi:periplasmic protein TonB
MAATLQVPTHQPVMAQTVRRASPEPHFDLLESHQTGGSYNLTFLASVLAHAALVAGIVVLPLLFFDELAPPTDAVRAFFVAPPAVTPPPPPPPPPPAAAMRRAAAAVPTPPPAATPAFRAPIEVPAELLPDPGIDLGTDMGMEGGVEGGIEGGVAGGIVGGIVGGVVGGMPTPAPEPVRVGGNIKAPKLLRRVEPIYPLLAAQARLRGVVVVEAQVDAGGIVRDVKVLRGMPLLDAAAVTAVQQWRYQPLLLNGQPTPFVVAVTVNFNLSGLPAHQ